MMDPTAMYPESFHPIANNRSRDYKRHAKHYTRTQRPPRYVWIDYGHARRYNPEDGPPLELPQLAGDKSPPEHNGPNQDIPCDPFATDIYFLGNFIRLHIYQNYFGFQFIYPLISDMTKADPSKRPKIDEVVAQYHKILDSLSGWKLRSGLIKRKEIVLSVYKLIPHFIRTIGYVCAGLPSIPNP
ncbi:uncharacterized protein STEHIDRAFT_76526 [Stereum hirsutum FP-91666 SS1]|uniref:uncharacterized protein n=1 Tax=Stereum hirsutum (strain FP-91666) TaxID=721885 RepID=UPI000440BE8E|nr:uncharacterized protein STEHIDRAFT_76526 [Stereum hirsutum FP-91666 SS1]EIM87890.1 hypothetical protein STEHIDRAFT_76526 [Stereum hirsutum FP-91666 SS1]